MCGESGGVRQGGPAVVELEPRSGPSNNAIIYPQILAKSLEKGAPNLDEIFAARSFVLQKQGKTKAAKSAWAKARRMNRYVRKISD